MLTILSEKSRLFCGRGVPPPVMDNMSPKRWVFFTPSLILSFRNIHIRQYYEYFSFQYSRIFVIFINFTISDWPKYIRIFELFFISIRTNIIREYSWISDIHGKKKKNLKRLFLYNFYLQIFWFFCLKYCLNT